MADENGNGKDSDAFGVLITQEEMAVAFRVAQLLGIEEKFGQSSPLGGVVVLLSKLSLDVVDLAIKVQILEKFLKEGSRDMEGLKRAVDAIARQTHGIG